LEKNSKISQKHTMPQQPNDPLRQLVLDIWSALALGVREAADAADPVDLCVEPIILYGLIRFFCLVFETASFTCIYFAHFLIKKPYLSIADAPWTTADL
jgi:hypothetical protein